MDAARTLGSGERQAGLSGQPAHRRPTGHVLAQGHRVDAVERVQDTASSHGSAFLVEVMGRRSGFLAASAAEACSVAGVVIPEQAWTLADLKEALHPGAVVLVSEGAWQEEVGSPESEKHLSGLVERLLGLLADEVGLSLRGTVLGHVLRGGSPCAADRLLASSFACTAVDTISTGTSALVVQRNGRTSTVDITAASSGRRYLSVDDIESLNTPVVGR